MSDSEKSAARPKCLQFEQEIRVTCPFPHDEDPQRSFIPFTSKHALTEHMNRAHNITITVNSVSLFLQEYLNELSKHERVSVSPETHEAIMNTAHRKKLNEMIELQMKERTEAASIKKWPCLFCKHILDSRESLLEHMYDTHSFHIGHLDNIVNFQEFLRILKDKLAACLCIYCEKKFVSAECLRRHMRKKKHFYVHPSNSLYDQFYIANYLKLNTCLDDVDDGYASEEQKWSDWDDDEQAVASCLFCHQCGPAELILDEHMPALHGFSFPSDLSFYDRVKLINYIRRKAFESRCFQCNEQVESLEDHFKQTDHSSQLPNSDEWRCSIFLFPTIEDDALLLSIDD